MRFVLTVTFTTAQRQNLMTLDGILACADGKVIGVISPHITQSR